MVDLAGGRVSRPVIDVLGTAEETRTAVLRGSWSLRAFGAAEARLERELRALAADPAVRWDLSEVTALDVVGTFLLWTAWDERLPAALRLRPEHEELFARWRRRPIPVSVGPAPPEPLAEVLARGAVAVGDHARGFVLLLGQVTLDLLHLLRQSARTPWREISATIHEAGGRALGITALVGLLIGIVIAYLSAVQLRSLGAQAYIVDILGLGIVRELGPMLAAILVAGRSGSAMTAQLGVMRVTQELDALAAMGVSLTERLVLPKIVALVITLPLLVVWTDIIALIGGMGSASLTLHISFREFVTSLPAAVPLVNFWIGLGKAAVFGLVIALTAGHFGLRIKPNTQSLGKQTTNAVVASITFVILLDAMFAILFQEVGV